MCDVDSNGRCFLGGERLRGQFAASRILYSSRVLGAAAFVAGTGGGRRGLPAGDPCFGGPGTFGAPRGEGILWPALGGPNWDGGRLGNPSFSDGRVNAP